MKFDVNSRVESTISVLESESQKERDDESLEEQKAGVLNFLLTAEGEKTG